MSVQQLISHLAGCRRRLCDLRARQDYLALACAILRLEGAGRVALYDQPFVRILTDRPFHDRFTMSVGETFAVAFYPVADGVQAEQIPAALAPVEAITGEIPPLLRQLSRPIRERLQLPDTENWWRTVFHLGWHFPRPFLPKDRRRLLAKHGMPAGRSNETFVQLFGLGDRDDLLPGLIYSDFEHDLCTCSEEAIGVIIEVLERHTQTVLSGTPEAQVLSADQRRVFDRLQSDFLAGTQMPLPSVVSKLLKLADSFTTPPASEWAGLEMGGCTERFLTLSRLNAMQEIAQIRGPATDWFCELGERAGNALPVFVLDCPILFDDPHRGLGGPRPVMNRGPLERWVGFVFATLKQYQPETVTIRWETPMGPLAHGLATLDRDLCAASVLAIDLARLTTAADEASKRDRASCSPFSVPSMEEQGVQWTDEVPPPPPPPEHYTLGQLLHDLRQFGESYHQNAEWIRQEHPAVQRHARIQLGAFVSQARDSLQRIAGFNELRALVQSLWRQEISFAVVQQLVDTLVRRSNGYLSPGDAAGLNLTETVAQLSAETPRPPRDPAEGISPAQVGADLHSPVKQGDKGISQQWSAGTFLAKAKELSRRLRSWHIEDYRHPIQFASQAESRQWVRLTFRNALPKSSSTPRPDGGLQLFRNEGGKLDERGCIGVAYRNPDEDTDRSLTQWLLADFLHHLEDAEPSPALDYLNESFRQLLDLPAWCVCEPAPPLANETNDERGMPRSYMVTGREVPTVFLDTVVDAADKLLTSARAQRHTEQVMPKPAQVKAKVLFFAANPDGTRQLALAEEVREIKTKIRASDHRDSLELLTEWAVRPDDLLQFLNQHKPTIVHFSGHGSSAAEIILLDRDRKPKPVSKEALTALFQALKGQIRVVFLNACFTQPQAEAIVQEIDCAVGMSRAVGDNAAIIFAANFYRALGFGSSVKNAFEQAKAGLMVEGIPEEDTPQLLVKAGVDPDQVLVMTPR
jgi:hypothetical protein